MAPARDDSSLQPSPAQPTSPTKLSGGVHSSPCSRASLRSSKQSRRLSSLSDCSLLRISTPPAARRDGGVPGPSGRDGGRCRGDHRLRGVRIRLVRALAQILCQIHCQSPRRRHLLQVILPVRPLSPLIKYLLSLMTSLADLVPNL
jgi:hypothetical protein